MPRPLRRLLTATLTLLLIGSGWAGTAARASDDPAAFGGRPSVAQVLARMSVPNALLDSYTVPVHVDVHLHRVITLHFGTNGTQYYKRPGHLALDLRSLPVAYRRLFGEIGTPLTWESTYDLRLADATVTDEHTIYRIEGAPRHASYVTHVVLEVDSDATVPVRGAWTCKDGTTVAMSFEEEPAGPYRLPKRAVADLAVGGYGVHAVVDYGPYAFNAVVADSVFAAP